VRLTSVELSNFKAFEDASFEIAPFTVLILFPRARGRMKES
jgi:predicted ATPase